MDLWYLIPCKLGVFEVPKRTSRFRWIDESSLQKQHQSKSVFIPGDSTHHNSIPLIPPSITTEYRSTPVLIHNHILAVPHFIIKFDFVGGEVIYVFDKGGMVADQQVGGIKMVDEEGSCQG